MDTNNTGKHTKEGRPDIECSKYRTIALLNHTSKVLMKVLHERLKAQTDTFITDKKNTIIADKQAGFRKVRNTKTSK